MGKLKHMYGSGIKALDNLAEELKVNNQLTYEDLKSEVAKHSSALEDVSGLLSLKSILIDLSIAAFNLIYVLQLFKGIALEADSLLNDLQNSLHKQEASLTAYAHQQREVCDFLSVDRTSELEMLNFLPLHAGTWQSNRDNTCSI